MMPTALYGPVTCFSLENTWTSEPAGKGESVFEPIGVTPADTQAVRRQAAIRAKAIFCRKCITSFRTVVASLVPTVGRAYSDSLAASIASRNHRSTKRSSKIIRRPHGNRHPRGHQQSSIHSRGDPRSTSPPRFSRRTVSMGVEHGRGTVEDFQATMMPGRFWTVTGGFWTAR